MNDLKSQNKTSFNLRFVPVTGFGSAYKHQKPDHRETLNYIHKERVQLNESWHKEYQANGHPKTLKNYLNDTKKVVKDKTTKSMQKKAEDKVIGEAVVVIDENTTMDDLKELGKRMEEKFGWTCAQIHIHRDEGYLGKRTEDMKHREGKYNLHAHMFFITTDLKTGKSWKMKGGEGSVMQDITAQTLRMERGVRKSERKEKVKETLNVTQFKQQQAEKTLEAITNETSLLSEKKTSIQNEIASIQNTKERLEGEKNNLSSEVKGLKEQKEELGPEVVALCLEKNSLSSSLKQEKEAFIGECVKVMDNGNKLLSRYLDENFDTYKPRHFEDVSESDAFKSLTLDWLLELAEERLRNLVRALMEAIDYGVRRDELQSLVRERKMNVCEGYDFIQPDGFAVKMDRPCTIEISTRGELIVEDSPGSGRYIILKAYLNRIINSVKQKMEDIKQDYKEETEKVKQKVKKKFKIGW